MYLQFNIPTVALCSKDGETAGQAKREICVAMISDDSDSKESSLPISL